MLLSLTLSSICCPVYVFFRQSTCRLDLCCACLIMHTHLHISAWNNCPSLPVCANLVLSALSALHASNWSSGYNTLAVNSAAVLQCCTLDDMLGGNYGNLPFHERLAAAARCCDALAYLHAQVRSSIAGIVNLLCRRCTSTAEMLCVDFD